MLMTASHPIPSRSVRGLSETLASLVLSVDCVVMRAFKGRDLLCFALCAIKEATNALTLQTDRMSCLEEILGTAC